jgi:acyl-CoA thioesterase FadM
MLSAVHVNNVVYNRYAESARVNWLHNFAIYIDPQHNQEWMALATPNSLGLTLQSMHTVYKFVSFGRTLPHSTIPAHFF